MTKGSEWRIWDLHLHTPCSVLNNGFRNAPSEDIAWENYVTAIEEKVVQKGISAIGVTDYFTIEGYKRLKEFQDKGRLKDILLIPNIEFRIDNIVGKDSKRMNLHVLVSPDISPTKIEENFLHDLDFVREGDPFESSKKDKLKISNLTDFGERLRSEHSKFKELSAIEVGFMTAVVRAQQIKDTLENSFKGKYLLVVADENLSDMDWNGQDHAVRKHLIQTSHAIFSSNEKTRQFGLGKLHETQEKFIKEFKSLKPCIWGCDSHNLEHRFLEPDENRYCWIKGDVSWEGLRQTIFEPEDRVRIQEKNPESSKSIYTIDSVKVEKTSVNENLEFEGFDLGINSNLVAIVGGRGSGKTALLDLIASCFQDGQKLINNKVSFYHRLYSDNFNSNPVDLNLTFALGESFNKRIGEDSSYFDKANINYLTQNHFDEFSADPERLNEHIINLVFNGMSDEKRKFDEINEDAVKIEREIQSINLNIEQLQDEIDGVKEEKESIKKIKLGEIEDYKQRIIDIETLQGKGNAEIAILTDRLETLKTQKRDLESFIYQIAEFTEFISDLAKSYEMKSLEFNEEIKSISQLGTFIELPISITIIQEIINITSEDRSIAEKVREVVIQEIEKNTKETDALEGISKTIADFRQKISETQYEINTITKEIEEVEQKEEEIKLLSNSRLEKYQFMLSKVVDAKKHLQSMIENFESDKNELLDQVYFSAVVNTEKTDFIESLLEKVDTRSQSSNTISSTINDIQQKIEEKLNAETIEGLSEITDDLIAFATGLKAKKHTSYSELYNTVLSKSFKVGLRVKYHNKALKALSMGERAIVLLKIMLSMDDKPLLIDQPEEHLDNRYIYDELTPAFRKAKTKRQIIIATHNANLVVNTDAEQIIVAEYENGKIKYTTGTLENLKTRDEIKKILEGGDEAFQKREQKYGYII